MHGAHDLVVTGRQVHGRFDRRQQSAATPTELFTSQVDDTRAHIAAWVVEAPPAVDGASEGLLYDLLGRRGLPHEGEREAHHRVVFPAVEAVGGLDLVFVARHPPHGASAGHTPTTPDGGKRFSHATRNLGPVHVRPRANRRWWPDTVEIQRRGDVLHRASRTGLCTASRGRTARWGRTCGGEVRRRPSSKGIWRRYDWRSRSMPSRRRPRLRSKRSVSWACAWI